MQERLQRSTPTGLDPALVPSPPGPLLRIACGELAAYVSPRAGGRLHQVAFAGHDWLVTYEPARTGAISWGCFPMVPWAGRLRRGQFRFDGTDYALSPTLGLHAIHGVGYLMPWSVRGHTGTRVELGLELPADARWPFGGSARQVIIADERRLTLTLAVKAGRRSMPAAIGWHPWFLKPDALRFAPEGYFPRDAEGIAGHALTKPVRGPWDDCFRNRLPVVLERGAHALRLESACPYWVVYDEPRHATCVEPQSGPPDAFNGGPACVLEPGAELASTLTWCWSKLATGGASNA